MSATHKLWPPYDRSGDFIPGDWLQQSYPQNNDMTELACRYHRETEAYDKTVCTGPVVAGVIYPLNRKELCLVNINAQKTLGLIKQEAAAKNIDPKDLMHEIRRVGLTGAWLRYQVGP